MTVTGRKTLLMLVLSASLITAACGSTEQQPPGSTGGGATVPTTTTQAVQSSSPIVASSPAAAQSPTSVQPAPTQEPAPPAAPAPAPVAPPAIPVPPAGLVTDADIAQATTAVAAMSVQDQAGTVIMASSADAVGADLVARLHLGGVILMGSKGAIDGTEGGTPEQVAAVTAGLQGQVPQSQTGAALLIGTDQESGLVTRLVNGFTEFPGADDLSAISDPATAAAMTEAVSKASGTEMLAVGINVDFAPDADVLPESGESGVAGRTFGTDPERTGALVAAAVRGYQSAGIAATIKHFPGIGRLATDTHKALPTLDFSCDEWNAVEAVPMRAGVDAGAALVMTGHVLMPAVGDTEQSSAVTGAVVTDLLRGSGIAGCTGMNFNGVTVSDSFQMAPIIENFSPDEAAWRGLAAGQDLVLMPKDPEAAVNGIAAAVANGSLPGTRLQEAATRVYALRLALARSPQPGLDVVGSAEHTNIAAEARAAG